MVVVGGDCTSAASAVTTQFWLVFTHGVVHARCAVSGTRSCSSYLKFGRRFSNPIPARCADQVCGHRGQVVTALVRLAALVNSTVHSWPYGEQNGGEALTVCWPIERTLADMWL
jgi:hypothetical protein